VSLQPVSIYPCGLVIEMTTSDPGLALGFLQSILAAASPLSDGGPPEWFRFASRFHLVLLHLPIGFIALAFLLEGYNLFRKSVEVRKVIGFTLFVTFASSIVVSALGVMLASDGGFDPETLLWHQWLGFAVVAYVVRSWL